ncbi:hypothetical protein HPB50_012323 [Hyalomma asiaticum]|uniref:Uncharacterized protein n=1 Tax=Hyalomma asiaticum TaxID=266040 RepID=A0ACB7RKV8_HYAAI|nr:hypothetical protein HPB50_012323 [Hyalomma asiaticum]
MDEPTSNMDPDGRREMWELLLKIRRSCSIFLTTQHLDEADVLADRIVIMANGQIRCAGSPTFLKQRFGTGYHMKVHKLPRCNIVGIQNLLRKYAPKARLESNSDNEAVFILGQIITTRKTVSLFLDIEQRSADMGIASVGLAVTSLEDVLVRVGEYQHVHGKSPTVAGEDIPAIDAKMPLVKMMASTTASEPSLWGCVWAVVLKRATYVWRQKKIPLFSWLLPPLLLSLLFFLEYVSLRGSGQDVEHVGDTVHYTFHELIGHTQGFFAVDKDQDFRYNRLLPLISNPDEFYMVDVSPDTDITASLLAVAKETLRRYVFNIHFGVQMTVKTGNVLWYNGQIQHMAPLVLGLYDTARLRNVTKDTTAYFLFDVTSRGLGDAQLAARSHRGEMGHVARTTQYRTVLPKVLRSIFFPLVSSLMCSNFVIFPTAERALGVKHLHMISGMSSLLYWLTNFAFDFMFYMGTAMIVLLPLPLVPYTTLHTDDYGENVLWYNGQIQHMAPLVLGLYDTARLRNVTKDTTAYFLFDVTSRGLGDAQLAARSHRGEMGHVARTTQYRTVLPKVLRSIFFPLVSSLMCSNFVIFPTAERALGVKHLHMISGMSSLLYWLTNFAFDFMFYMGTAMIVLLPLPLVPYTTLHTDDYELIFVLNLLHGLAALPVIYICSFLYTDPASAYSTLVIVMFLISSAGCLGSVLMEHYIEDVSGAGVLTVLDLALQILRLLPSYSYSRGMTKIIQLARENAICQQGGLQLESRCQTRDVKGRLSLMQCCLHKDAPDPSEYMIHPLDVHSYSAFYEFLTLSLEGPVLFVLLLRLESWLRRMDRYMSSLDPYTYEEGAALPKRPSGAIAKGMALEGKEDEDSDVMLENELVRMLAKAQLPATVSRPFMVVNRLYKAYGYFESLSVLQGLSFTVRNGECFGLLGVNGAGKTTTFRLLTGEILPHSGDATFANFSIVRERQQCWRYMGYCPQRDGLLDMLTGVETVLLFGRLRGIPITKDYLTALLSIFRLQEIADYLVGTYSAGNRRKLSMCISMMGLPRIVLLDEPYAAISTTARRRIVNYVSALQKVSKMAILLSSHSLSDIEFLCNRIAIMDAGKLQCLGSLGQLKEKFGKGYTITVKTYPDKKQDFCYQDAVANDVCKAFREAEMVYSYEGLLEFRMLRVNMLWSDMFMKMSRIKRRHKLQDFFITDTSLEQIFQSVTRKEAVEAAAAAVAYQPPGAAPQVLASTMGL